MNLSDDVLYQCAPKARDLWLNAAIDSTEAFEHEFSKRFQRKMQKLIKQQRRPMSQLKRVAVFILISAALTFSGLMTVDAYRAKVIEVIIDIYERFTTFGYQSDAQGNNHGLGNIHFAYMPDGFAELEREEYEFSRYLYFEHSDGDYIEFEQVLVDENTVHTQALDTEDAIIERFLLNGEEATAVTKRSETTVLWLFDGYVCRLQGSVEVDELKEISKNIKIFF